MDPGGGTAARTWGMMYLISIFQSSQSQPLEDMTEDEEGGAWFIGDETESLVSQDMFVNAWMSLPEPYRAEVEEN